MSSLIVAREAVEGVEPPIGRGLKCVSRVGVLLGLAVVLEREWDLAKRVNEPLRGQLPDDPEEAARHAHDDVIRRMNDLGELSHTEIADIVGLTERTIPIAIQRARAFAPPLPPADGASEPDIGNLAR